MLRTLTRCVRLVDPVGSVRFPRPCARQPPRLRDPRPSVARAVKPSSAETLAPRGTSQAGFWLGPCPAKPQQESEQWPSKPRSGKQILAVNDAFYSAFTTRAFDAMEKLWATSATVTCVHPGWNAARGREPVIISWQSIL